jgi:hypothetical protein
LNSLVKILSGIGLLIGLGILIWNYRGAVAIVDTLGKNSISGIKTLQGRA